MAKHYYSQFEQRQEMHTSDFEIFYYEDKISSSVSMHRHDYYEIYFFLEGDLHYQIGKEEYPLSHGDLCLIPPGLFHRPRFHKKDQTYRRIVLWLSPAYLKTLKDFHPDISYGFDFCSEKKQYHFSLDFSSSQQIFEKLLDILEERNRREVFQVSMLSCEMMSLLLSINRMIYHDGLPPAAPLSETSLFSKLCDYIHLHLEDDLSLDALARHFFVSKYHISHVFKENMGISLHQYLSKKRIYACKNLLLAGHPIHEIAETYGFKDYSSFFRAFKKEFHMGPKEYREMFSLSTQNTREITDTVEHAVLHKTEKTG